MQTTLGAPPADLCAELQRRSNVGVWYSVYPDHLGLGHVRFVGFLAPSGSVVPVERAGIEPATCRGIADGLPLAYLPEMPVLSRPRARSYGQR